MPQVNFMTGLVLVCGLWLTACDQARIIENKVTHGAEASSPVIGLPSLSKGSIKPCKAKSNSQQTSNSWAFDHPGQSDDPSQNDGDAPDPDDPPYPDYPDDDCDDRPGKHEVKINEISYSGSGCSEGSVLVNISPDLQAFTMVFADFVAEAGPLAEPGRSHVECQVRIVIDQPKRWSFALTHVDIRGFVDIDDQVLASLKVQTKSKSSVFVGLDAHFLGPLLDNFNLQAKTGSKNKQWSACGSQELILDTIARVDNTAASDLNGLLTVDSLDGELRQTYGLVWKACD